MGTFLDHPIDAMPQEEKRFFKELGARIAQLRREQNLTQLPKPKQRAVMEVLDAMIAQAGR